MKNNRVAIFAHYDLKDEIQDYVIYYLQELQKIANNIVFVSDSDIHDSELEKIKPFIHKAIVGRHGEYDFGSYKRGYIYLRDNDLLKNCEELILANDSCYAPLFPFEEMFSEMSIKDVDFWGPTANVSIAKNFDLSIEHVQSYFIVFKPQVFNSEIFDKFMVEIKHEESKRQIIIKYELGLSKLLKDCGFKYDVYCQLSKGMEGCFIHKYKELIKNDRNPFLKRSIALYKNIQYVYPLFLGNFIKNSTNYNFELIKKDQKKYVSNLNFAKAFIINVRNLKYFIRNCRKNIISIRLNKNEQKIVLFSKELFNSTRYKN